jgi:hypothetical protein
MKIVLTLIFLIINLITWSQTNIDTSTVTINKKDIENIVIKSEINKTPEEQGYTKYTLNGVIFYRKEEGQIKLKYKPNY